MNPKLEADWELSLLILASFEEFLSYFSSWASFLFTLCWQGTEHGRGNEEQHCGWIHS